MNIYTAQFFANCPNNGARIHYALRIETPEQIPVEQINAVLDATDEGFHEEIADQMHERFGGTQILKAHHHGVDIETRREVKMVLLKDHLLYRDS